jgi:hypothetical protein
MMIGLLFVYSQAIIPSNEMASFTANRFTTPIAMERVMPTLGQRDFRRADHQTQESTVVDETPAVLAQVPQGAQVRACKWFLTKMDYTAVRIYNLSFFFNLRIWTYVYVYMQATFMMAVNILCGQVLEMSADEIYKPSPTYIKRMFD